MKRGGRGGRGVETEKNRRARDSPVGRLGCGEGKRCFSLCVLRDLRVSPAFLNMAPKVFVFVGVLADAHTGRLSAFAGVGKRRPYASARTDFDPAAAGNCRSIFP